MLEQRLADGKRRAEAKQRLGGVLEAEQRRGSTLGKKARLR
jgi:hypothetical protein